MEIDLFGNLIVEEEVSVIKPTKKSPFDYTNDISNKNYPDDFDDYNPWLANSSFSQRKDTVIYANEINKYHQLENRAQFDWYYHSLPKKKYFAKWAKAVKSDYTTSITAYYNVSSRVALDYEKVLTKDQLNTIQEWYDKRTGGR